ncbi:DUF664 domain-containing protein [Streptomyces sp. SL13]|uniref:DUF664 domain-containing protein n=1 Tax=Streptantibioticus silvisoli TaxID=2705255 RepID=A0AA90KJ31_9ACTN|nr:DUF664 domain-containing protein [Streptantibioticus silvisoli]MDI5974085.1 DUF664 domain-containing protein [Streptantibioticus silvisoli]
MRGDAAPAGKKRRLVAEPEPTTPARREREEGTSTLRWIPHHLIQETARHDGPLDILRELADGTVGS